MSAGRPNYDFSIVGLLKTLFADLRLRISLRFA